LDIDDDNLLGAGADADAEAEAGGVIALDSILSSRVGMCDISIFHNSINV
jgi:hypothetical protein